MAQEQYETAIRRAIAKNRAETPEQRERIYTVARESFRRSGKGVEELAALDAAIKLIEDTFSSPLKISRRPAGMKIWAIPAFAAGLAVGVVAAYALSNTSSSATEVDDPAFAQRYFERAYKENAALMPVAIGYLSEITDAIVERQRNDRASLAKSEKTFIGLAAFDAQLAKKLPAALPRGTSVIVRANAKDFKVLMNWTMCGIASISNPEMVDKVRTSTATIGCPFFGTWTSNAATW